MIFDQFLRSEPLSISLHHAGGEDMFWCLVDRVGNVRTCADQLAMGSSFVTSEYNINLY